MMAAQNRHIKQKRVAPIAGSEALSHLRVDLTPPFLKSCKRVLRLELRSYSAVICVCRSAFLVHSCR